jgi:CO/xanthine dehydrogenase Mo-binding subunit
MLELAAGMMEANPNDLEIENGLVFVKGVPKSGIALAQIARQAFLLNGGPIIVSNSTTGKSLQPNPDVLQGLFFGVGAIEFIHPVQIAEVEVDPDTGHVNVIGFVSAHDIGKAINPAGVVGQINGAVAQGIGYALFEEITCQDGIILNPNVVRYLQPTSRDVPRIESVLIEDGPGRGPYGAKGIAEAPIIPTAPAIANAIYDAIRVRIKSLPITPEKILEALRQSR